MKLLCKNQAEKLTIIIRRYGQILRFYGQFLVLNYDLSLHGEGRGQFCLFSGYLNANNLCFSYFIQFWSTHGLRQQKISEDLFDVTGEYPLSGQRTIVFDRQNHGESTRNMSTWFIYRTTPEKMAESTDGGEWTLDKFHSGIKNEVLRFCVAAWGIQYLRIKWIGKFLTRCWWTRSVWLWREHREVVASRSSCICNMFSFILVVPLSMNLN